VDPNAPVDRTEYSGPVGAANRTVTLDTVPDESAMVAAAEEARAKGILPPLSRENFVGAHMSDLPQKPVAPAEVPHPPRSRRLIFTGRGLENLIPPLQGRHFSLIEGSLGLVKRFFPNIQIGDPGYQELLNAVYHWGTGEITEKYPATITRALFVNAVCAIPGFENYGGDAGYWTDGIVNAAKADETGQLLIVTGISDTIGLNYFKALGFQHWHVTGPAADGLTLNKLSAQLDNETLRALSAQRQGPKLRVIWNSPQPHNPRLWTVQEFLDSYREQTSILD
jgi:hypothetical protein